MNNQLNGIAISGYRSFGSEMQYFYPLRRMNILIGANNSGKSNLLKFLHAHLDSAVTCVKNTGAIAGITSKLDQHIHHSTTHPIAVRFLASFDNDKAVGIALSDASERSRNRLRKLLLQAHPFSHPAKDSVWIGAKLYPSYESGIDAEYARNLLSAHTADISQVEKRTATEDVRHLHSKVTSRSGGSVEDALMEVIARINRTINPVAETAYVPAIRQLAQKNSEDSSVYSGQNVIRTLFTMMYPHHNDEIVNAPKIESIKRFARSVVGNAELDLQIPHDYSTINVRLDGRLLPIESLGTGISEVIMLAVAATLETEKIVCIEEPEIHLHPMLQRKLIRYLTDETDNQYFITTHSASLIDGVDPETTSIFHCHMEDGCTRISSVNNPAETFAVCRELGYRASDIMQSNCIIWVEGQSDRIYINAWLAELAASLREGVEYSIMYYGGRCLAGMTVADEPGLDNLVPLLRINRNCVVVIDSDKSKAGGRINATKRRIRDEVNETGGLCWVTEGREIENYVPAEMRKAAIRTVHPRTARFARIKDGQYEHGLIEKTNKVKVAEEVARQPIDWDCFDLRKQVKKLAAFIAAHSSD